MDGDDSDWYRQVAADLEFVADILELDMTTYTAKLYEQADQVERAQPMSQEDEDAGERWEFSSTSHDDVDQIFDMLRHEVQHST